MTTDFDRLFRPALTAGNPIREIGFEADAISRETGVSVIRLHLGNPSTAQRDDVKAAMHHSIDTRISGYGPHAGTGEERAALAAFFNDSEGVPAHFAAEDCIFFPGATLITKALLHMFAPRPDLAVLLPSPGYPVYENQARAEGLEVLHYGFDALGLIDEKTAIGQVVGAAAMIITYPHNPTGKALTQDEARLTGALVNRLHEKNPDMIFYNDAVYSGTCAASVGYNSFYPYLDESAKMRTVTGVSGAKLAAMGGERIGGIAAKDKTILHMLANAQSQMSAGISVHAVPGFLAALKAFEGQWTGGKATGKARDAVASFYQERIKIVTQALRDLEARHADAGAQQPGMIVPFDPAGGMYVYADFTPLLKDKPMPESLRGILGEDRVATGKDLRRALMHAHALGLTPVSTVQGEVFSEDPAKICLRISCVERDIQKIDQAMQTIAGVVDAIRAAA